MASTSSAKLAGYETTFITRPEITDEAQKALVEKLTGVISSFSGEPVLSEDWGRRKMAYPIHKESRGLYTYIVYTGKGDIVHEIERNLRLNEHVLRFLTVNLETEFDADAFRKHRADIHAAAKRREEEREARREERNAERRGYESHDDRRGYEGHEDRGSSSAADEGAATESEE